MVSPCLKQTWTVMGVLLNMFGQGMVLSYPSVILPALLSPNSIIKAEFHEASWVASCIGIASIPGFLSSSFLMEMYGRKKAHVAVLIPGIVGWLIIYFATSIPVLLCGRCLCGFAVGATISLGAIVIGEYTSPKNRGIFLNLKTAAVCLGNMAVHILAHFLNWNTIALIAVIPLMLALLIILTWPESPSWLASKRRFDESQKSFYWLRGNGKRAILEMEDLLRTQKEKLSQYPEHVDSSNMIMDFIGKFKDRSFVKPLIIVCFAGLLLESILCIYLMMAMQATPYLLVTVQVYGTFAVFGLLMGISLIALYVILPETKDRTLQQIEYYFQTGKFRHDNLGIDEVNMKMLSS
nr:facilitated trehalose transporter Tret1-like [Danaus plexippus plexippus]